MFFKVAAVAALALSGVAADAPPTSGGAVRDSNTRAPTCGMKDQPVCTDLQVCPSLQQSGFRLGVKIQSSPMPLFRAQLQNGWPIEVMLELLHEVRALLVRCCGGRYRHVVTSMFVAELLVSKRTLQSCLHRNLFVSPWQPVKCSADRSTHGAARIAYSRCCMCCYASSSFIHFLESAGREFECDYGYVGKGGICVPYVAKDDPMPPSGRCGGGGQVVCKPPFTGMFRPTKMNTAS